MNFKHFLYDDLSFDESRVLKLPTIIVSGPIYSIMSNCAYFMKLGAPMFNVYVHLQLSSL
jgi:hypothetical protein